MDGSSERIGSLRRFYRRWRPPVGLWRLRGYASARLGGETIRFGDIVGTPDEWWAIAAKRGRWERPVVDAFAAAVPAGGVVFDVGAWIGPYTLLASRLVGPGGRVFSFEPDPVARRLLERNIALNGADNVTVVPAALGPRDETKWLSGGHSEARIGDDGEHQVTMTTLAGFIEEQGVKPDVIKVDIEGGELTLGTDTLRSIGQLFIEIHEPVFRENGVDSQAFLDDIAAGRSILRLEGDSDNYNVRIA